MFVGFMGVKLDKFCTNIKMRQFFLYCCNLNDFRQLRHKNLFQQNKRSRAACRLKYFSWSKGHMQREIKFAKTLPIFKKAENFPFSFYSVKNKAIFKVFFYIFLLKTRIFTLLSFIQPRISWEIFLA